MQTVDHSVAAAKAEFVRLGGFTSAHQRNPALQLDQIARAPLDRFLTQRGDSATP